MAKRLREMIKSILSSRRWRMFARSRQMRLIGIMLVLSFVLVALISIIEVRVNESFDSIIDVFYWAMITITTVGYGDITPHTIAGKILAVLLILIGVVLVSFMTATIASILTATRIREGMGLKKVELDGHIVICGYNVNLERIIRGVVNAAPTNPPEIVLVNSYDESVVNALIERFPEAPIRFVYGDYSQETTLNRASITKAASAIVLADPGPDNTAKPDDRTLLTVLAIKSISQDVRVSVEVLEHSSEVHLRRAGVDQIIIAGEFSGFLLSNSVMAPGIPQALKEMMYVNVGSDMSRISFPAGFVGKTFREAAIEMLDSTGSILIGVITEKKSFNLETVLSGDKGAIDDFIRRKFEEAGRSLEVESKGLITVNLNPGGSYVIGDDDYAVVITSKRESTSV